MVGAIIGDIVGSRFEHNNVKTEDFDRSYRFSVNGSHSGKIINSKSPEVVYQKYRGAHRYARCCGRCRNCGE